MPVAYVILAHRAPAQLGRLVDRLVEGGTAKVYLHIDRRTAKAVHGEMVAALPRRSGVHHLPRVASAWAGWGLVEASLSGLRAAVQYSPEKPPTHVVLMTGQDYLLRPAAAAAAFFEANRGLSFMPAWPLPSEHYGGDGGLHRVRYWHRAIGRRRLWIPIRRSYPAGLTPHGGPQIMALDHESVRRLLNYSDTHPEAVRFHRHVWVPDEHYVQTVLRSTTPDPASRLLDENLWHIEWPPPPTRSKHPRTFDLEGLPRLLDAARRSSDAGGPSRAKLFARKFDLESAPEALAAIDRELLGR